MLMTEILDDRELVRFKEMLMANSIQVDVEWGQIFSLDKSSCFGNIGAWQDP
jgi:hypothetical protein